MFFSFPFFVVVIVVGSDGRGKCIICTLLLSTLFLTDLRGHALCVAIVFDVDHHRRYVRTMKGKHVCVICAGGQQVVHILHINRNTRIKSVCCIMPTSSSSFSAVLLTPGQIDIEHYDPRLHLIRALHTIQRPQFASHNMEYTSHTFARIRLFLLLCIIGRR